MGGEHGRCCEGWGGCAREHGMPKGAGEAWQGSGKVQGGTREMPGLERVCKGTREVCRGGLVREAQQGSWRRGGIGNG